MKKVPLYFPLALALIFSVFGTIFVPHIKLFAFSPFLALLYNRLSFLPSVWIASFCGLIIDLLSSEFRLGIHALNYALTTYLLYKQKRHFFEEKPLAISLFTAVISIVSTLLQILLISIFDRSLSISLKGLATDLFVMPMADGIYAFLWFSCPMLLFAYIQKAGWRHLFFKCLSLFVLKKSTQDSSESP